jgi:hypothetical protein
VSSGNTVLNGQPMSALGHKRTFCDAGAMSALPPKADIRSAARDVRYGPIADICICSLDDDVHALQKSVWDTQAYGLCSLEVDGQFELRGLLDRYVFRPLAL